jgi:hypothetical protein
MPDDKRNKNKNEIDNKKEEMGVDDCLLTTSRYIRLLAEYLLILGRKVDDIEQLMLITSA